MSMWARMKRVFRSFFGAMIGAAEDPKLILEQNMRDMRDKVPEMNNGIAKARAGIIRLEREIATQTIEHQSLKEKWKLMQFLLPLS